MCVSVVVCVSFTGKNTTTVISNTETVNFLGGKIGFKNCKE